MKPSHRRRLNLVRKPFFDQREKNFHITSKTNKEENIYHDYERSDCRYAYKNP